ncbi:MAG: hypothetical protein MHM6MM_004617 [Cercozoa sp. M6MM]
MLIKLSPRGIRNPKRCLRAITMTTEFRAEMTAYAQNLDTSEQDLLRTRGGSFRGVDRLRHDTKAQHADVVVVGAGLAGLSTALSLLEKRPSLNVVVLEKSEVASNCSGRNGGFVHTGFAAGEDGLIQAAGAENARALFDLTKQGMDTVRRRINEVDSRAIGAYGMLTCDWFGEDLAEELDELNEVLDAGFRLLSPEEREVLVSSPKYNGGAVWDESAFSLNPLKYSLVMLRLLKQATVYEHTEVQEVRRKNGSFQVIVQSEGSVESATIEAGQVVLARGPWDTSLRVRTYMMCSDPMPRELLRQHLRTGACVTDTRFACDYYRVIDEQGYPVDMSKEADDLVQLLWGGRCDASLWSLSQNEIAPALLKDAQKVLPVSMQAQSAWAGTMAYAPHRMPVVGCKDGVWMCTAFGGHGMSTTAACADLLAEGVIASIENQPLPANLRLFAPFLADKSWWENVLPQEAACALAYSLLKFQDQCHERLGLRADFVGSAARVFVH